MKLLYCNIKFCCPCMLFENTFVEKAIEVLEERGVITDDCDIEVIRASSI